MVKLWNIDTLNLLTWSPSCKCSPHQPTPTHETSTPATRYRGNLVCAREVFSSLRPFTSVLTLLTHSPIYVPIQIAGLSFLFTRVTIVITVPRILPCTTHIHVPAAGVSLYSVDPVECRIPVNPAHLVLTDLLIVKTRIWQL